MIELIDGFAILVDEYNYSVAQDTGKVDKEGRKRWIKYGHYSSLMEAIRGARDIFIRRRLSNGCISLERALAVVKDETMAFEMVMREATND